MTSSASAAASDPEFAPGYALGKYRVVRMLGVGGMGAVYEAEHPELGQRVAIKVLLPSILSNAEAVERFLREGRAAARVRHPNVVQIFDVDRVDGRPFLVMELLDGEDLAQRLHDERQLVLEDTLTVMLPVLAAVQAAHDHGVLHRDLKPENIFLSRSSNGPSSTKVLDFGISRIGGVSTASNLTQENSVLGTPAYLSPEQARGARDVDARADQYALGIVLYECLAGRKPYIDSEFLAMIHSILTGDRPPLATLAPDLPEEVVAAVERAIAIRRDDRFASVRELGRELLRWAAPRDVALWEPTFIEGGAKPERRDPTGRLSREAGSRPSHEVSRIRDRPSSADERAATVAASAPTPPLALDEPAALPPPSRAPWVVVGVIAVAALSAAAMFLRPAPAPPIAPAAVVRHAVITIEPTDARVTVDGEARTSPLVLDLVEGAPALSVRVEAPGHVARTISLSARDIPDRIVLERTLPAGAEVPAVPTVAATPVEPVVTPVPGEPDRRSDAERERTSGRDRSLSARELVEQSARGGRPENADPAPVVAAPVGPAPVAPAPREHPPEAHTEPAPLQPARPAVPTGPTGTPILD